MLSNDPIAGQSRTVARTSKPVSPWVSLETISAAMPGSIEPATYHALGQADYVQVLCLHVNGALVLVKQYRPVVDQWTLEFPGGLRDGTEPAAETARREVEEETGLSVLELFGLVDCFADVGRLTNRFHGFVAIVRGSFRQTEPGVEAMFVDGKQLHNLATTGQLAIPGNLGLLYLASTHPAFRAACERLGIGQPPWMML